LRAKLGADGDRFVLNVWGVGYRLVDDHGAALSTAEAAA
jgi:DNA-binding response OmpR family regulator